MIWTLSTDRDIGDAEKGAERDVRTKPADGRLISRGTPYVARIDYRKDSYEEP